LRVIGRTSVMQYKSGIARDLRKIGKQLGVAHLVEGSVQRSGDHVRVNAQLFDSRSERSLWGQTYDGDLVNFFAIQSQIALAIANELHATLSANEKREIERPATKDITAFDLYARAKRLFSTPSFNVSSKPNLLQAENLLNESVARDPSFFEDIACWPLFTTRCTSLVTTVHRRVWPSRKPPSKLPLPCVAMRMRPTSRVHGIFTGGTSITTVLWLSWTLHGR